MDNKILTEETKETEKEAGKEVENGFLLRMKRSRL